MYAFVQEVTVEKFESSPIIFGDFIKVGADPSDRLYEELTDMKKIRNVLNEVCMYTHCTTEFMPLFSLKY